MNRFSLLLFLALVACNRSTTPVALAPTVNPPTPVALTASAPKTSAQATPIETTLPTPLTDLDRTATPQHHALTPHDQTATSQTHSAHHDLTAFDLTATAQAVAPQTPTTLATIALAPSVAFTPAANVTIQIDGGTRYQTMSGFGASFAPFNRPGNRQDDPNAPAIVSATDAQRDAMLQIWFNQLGLTRARLFPDAFEPVNDNADPFTLNSAGFDWSKVNQLTEFARLARPVGLQTPWASFSMEVGHTQAWLRKPDSCSLDPGKLDEEVEWLFAAAQHFRDAGIELPYMTINNEPDLAACKDRIKIEIPDYVSLVKRLGARLRAAGIATKIVVSDGWLPQNVLHYAQAVLADPDARQYVGALAYHAYSDGYDDPARLLENSAASNPPHAGVQVRAQIRALAARYNLAIWMTEICYCTPRAGFSEFELLRARLNHLHDELTLGNVSAFDAINLYNIRRPGVSDELVEVFYRPDGTMERYQIATYGYLLGQYARFIVPGSVRLKAESNDPRVRVVAFQRPDGKLVLVALNNNDFAVQATLNIIGLNPTPKALSILSSREGAIWQTPRDIALSGVSGTATLPPKSVTTFVEK